MRAFIDKMLAQLKEYFGKMQKKHKVRLFILSLLVIVLAIVAVVLLSQTNYVLLHNAADLADAGRIDARLQEMGVQTRIEGATRIMVPENSGPDELRARLASEGVIGQAQLDYSWMQEASGFGVTDAYARRIFEIQTGSNVSALIMQADRIQNAVVTVTFGDTSPFRTATNVRPATAAVMLRVSDGSPLTNQEVQSIAGIVRGSVPGILNENIKVTDSNLNEYRITDANEDSNVIISSRITMEELLKQQIASSVEQLLAPIFLRDNIRVLPAVTLNFDRVNETHIEYAPPIAGELEGIPRSASELYRIQRNLPEEGGIPGTDENGMGMGEYPWGEFGENDVYLERLLEYNYEINETLTVIEREQGTIESLSIGILINSEVMLDDMTEEVRNLVSMGAGIVPDNISIEALQFAEDTTMIEAQEAWDAYIDQLNQRELINTIIKWSVILLLGIFLILLIRTIVNAAKPPPELVYAEAGGLDYLVGDDDAEDILSELEEMPREEIEHKKQSELEDIENFIEKDPASVAQLLRNWLTDEQ